MNRYDEIRLLFTTVRTSLDSLEMRLNMLEAEDLAERRRVLIRDDSDSLAATKTQSADDDDPPRTFVLPTTLEGSGPRIAPTASDEGADRIIGGTEVPHGGFPDCCAVGDDRGFYCSGALIAANLVVTAKHCIGARRVFVGGNRVNLPHPGETIRVVQQISHPRLDMSLLILERASAITPCHVAQGTEVKPRDNEVTLVGFGTVDPDGKFGYGIKRMVTVPVKSLDCVSMDDQNRYGALGGLEMVAGQRGLNRDTCSGDSGGPAYVQSAEGAYYLLGITSRGIPAVAGSGCGDGGIYVRVDLLLPWIRTATGIAIEGPRF